MSATAEGRRGGKRTGTSPRRVTTRAKTLKSAKIVFNQGKSVLDCLVHDLSDTGAKLKLGDVTGVPRIFILEMKDGTRRNCERVRFMGQEIGIRFLH